MNAKKLETWVWVLIYGGLVLLMVGLWTLRRDADLGGWLAAGGAVAAVVGTALVWVRSRMKDGSP